MKARLTPTALAMLAVVTSTLVAVHTPARSRFVAPAAERTTASLPTLTGEEAVTHLKQQGLYSSLGDAVRAARYGARALPSGDAFEFVNPANGWRATFDAADRNGTLVDDFRLDVGRNAVWVRNAPSPAATSSLAIAEELVAHLCL